MTWPWTPGTAPVAVIMISLNEAHNLEAVLTNIEGWAKEVFLVDSFSRDETVGIALRRGVHVVQRRFHGFGDQWNYALQALPITAPYTMKLDPDERLTDELKASILEATRTGGWDGLTMERRLWFMGRPLPRREPILRVWRTGVCRFSDVKANEHPLIDGVVRPVAGLIEHLDSPDLDHWIEKQNRYSTAEAISLFCKSPLSAEPKLFGGPLNRRMWLKVLLRHQPFMPWLMFLYVYLWKGTWQAGWQGYAAASLTAIHWRLIFYKYKEMKIRGCLPLQRCYGPGVPDPRAIQSDSAEDSATSVDTS
jgi:glycosyltransferase involved in cell wall biosynthesis